MVVCYCFDVEVFMRKLTLRFPVTGWIKHSAFRLLTPVGRHTITLRGSQKPKLSTIARARSETTRHLYVLGFEPSPRFLVSQFPSDETINRGPPCAYTRMQRDRLRTLKILWPLSLFDEWRKRWNKQTFTHQNNNNNKVNNKNSKNNNNKKVA